jgi:uncharacterized protein
MNDINETTIVKIRKLQDILLELRKTAVAFSGGVDSAYLLYEALQVLSRKNVLALTVHSELHSQKDTDYAEKTARSMGAAHLVVTIDLLTDPVVKDNLPDRCYHCKKNIYSRLSALALAKGFPNIIDGSNFDDSLEDRPGLRALSELAVQSPLLEAGLTKSEIRLLARRAGIQSWNRPSIPCLATRFPHGEAITVNNLKIVSDTEDYLRSVTGVEGNIRVRLHSGNLARIEAEPGQWPLIMNKAGELSAKLRKNGIVYIVLDLEGFRSSSMSK